MGELNTQVWGTGIEMNPFENKLDENKVYYATTSTRPTGGDDQDNKSQTYTLDRLEADGKIVCGQDFDLSPCYIMVDENCPWTKSVTYRFITENGTNSSERLDTGIINESKAVPVMIGTGYNRPGTNLNNVFNCSTSINSTTGSAQMPYYMLIGWKNNRRLTNDRVMQYSTTRKYKTLPSVNEANFQPFVKFGGKSIIARIMVQAKTTSGSYQTYSLYDYCYKGTNYTDRPVVVSVYYDAQIIDTDGRIWRDKTGGAWSSTYSGNGITAVPLTSEYTFEVSESVDCKASTWGTYLLDGAYPCLFGTHHTTISLSTTTTYFNSIDTHSSFEQNTAHPNVLTPITQNDLWGTVDDFYEYFMRSAAYLGLFFTPYNTTDFPFTVTNQDEMFSDDKMYCGVIDENGVTHGEYTHGTANEDQVQYTSKDLQKDSNVDAGGGGGKTPYDATTTAHKRVAGQGISGHWILFPYTELTNTTYFSFFMEQVNLAESIESANFYGQNPIDCVIEAKEVYLPESFASNWTSSSSIPVGDYNIPLGASILPEVLISSIINPITFNCGTIQINGIYDDFRDYEPYTQMQLYIPFCGLVDLKPSVCVGHNLKLEEEIEYVTGDILANIYVDNCLYTSTTGNCASDLSVNGLAVSNYAQIRAGYIQKALSDVVSGAMTLESGIAGGAIAASYGNTLGVRAQRTAGALGAIQNSLSAIHDIKMFKGMHPAAVKIQNGAPSPQSNAVFYPFVIRQYPLEFDNFDMESFSKLNGIACYDTGKLSEIASGLTICSEYILNGIMCTNEEKQMIAHLLESGVIV